MAVKSIVEIDVNDANFRAFKRLYDQYATALRSAPAAWRLVNQQIDGSRASFDKMVSKMAAANVQAQLAAKAQQRADYLTRTTSERWASIARSTMSFAGSLRDVATSVLRMAGVTGVITGLVGGGGLWGLDRLGTAAAASRRSALGLGTGVGPMQAFGSAFERFVDPDFLERIAAGRFSLQGSVGLLGAGLSPREMAGDTAQVGRAMLQHLKRIADATDPRMMEEVIGALRLPVSRQEMIRLRNTRPEEIQRQFAQQQEFAGRLQIDDKTLRRWQDFTTNLEFAGKMIEKTLIVGLADLSTPLGHLSDAVTHVFESFMKAVKDREWVKTLSDNLEQFAHTLGDPKFAEDVQRFVTGVGKMGEMIGKVVGWFAGDVAKATEPQGTRMFGNAPLLDLGPFGKIDPRVDPNSWLGRAMSGPVNNPGNLRIPNSNVGFQQFPSPEAGVLAMARQLQLYGSRDRLDTLAGIISKYAPPTENDTKAYISDVAQRTHLSATEHLNLGDPETISRVIAAMIAHEQRRGSYEKYKDAQVVVKIIKPVGSDVAVSTNALNSPH